MSNLKVVYKHDALEIMSPGGCIFAYTFSLEEYCVVVFLSPLYKSALEVSLCLINLVEGEVCRLYFVYQQSVYKVISLVEVYCAHHCFEGIAEDMFLRYGC